MTTAVITKIKKLKELDFLFKELDTDSWTMTIELAEFNCAYYSKKDINVTKKIKCAIDCTNNSEMYLFDKTEKKMRTKKDIWALNAYLEFLDEYNENLVLEGKKEVNEFPITEEIIKKVIEFWTDRYAVNTMRQLLCILNQIQSEENHEKYDGNELNTISDCLEEAQLRRNVIRDLKGLRREGSGKVPCFYPVLLYILDLVPSDYKNREFYFSAFLFGLCSGQRYITISNVKVSDISRTYTSENNKFGVTIIARITKCNRDWNQSFNLEGSLEYNENEVNQMDAVYWLNQHLKLAHRLDLKDFGKKNWEKNQSYLLGDINKMSVHYSKPVTYQNLYLTWKLFCGKAGIPIGWFGLHSFRSGFYCQSLLNTSSKYISIDTMNELTQMLAGWRQKRDQEVYFKPIMSELTTISGYIKDPTIEMLVGCEGVFKSNW